MRRGKSVYSMTAFFNHALSHAETGTACYKKWTNDQAYSIHWPKLKPPGGGAPPS